MWICENCNESFEFPEIKRPDAGILTGEGILGLKKLEPIKFCPICLSTYIRKEQGTHE